MRPELHSEITRRIHADFGFKPKRSGAFLRGGKCPSCDHKELYTHAEAPWTLRCGRLNNCGYVGHIKDVYPDLFNSWSDRFERSPENPHAAADAYLRDARGFQLDKVRGTYTQETYVDPERAISSATVRFTLSCGAWWQRLIDRPERFGKKKSTFGFGHSYKGEWWHLPDVDPSNADELWIVEGIFDAIALAHHGIKAVAALSCNNYPEEALKRVASACSQAERVRPKLVWALDGDSAGRTYARRWHAQAEANGWDCRMAIIPQPRGGKKVDWNDLHQRDALDEKARADFLYHGSLETAKSAAAKALLMYKRREQSSFPFDFGMRLYWWRLDVDKFLKAKATLDDNEQLSDVEKRDRALADSGLVSELANVLPEPLYYQANELTDEQWYYFRVRFPHSGAPVKAAFTGAQVASASEFKKRLLSIAPGALFHGNTVQLDRYVADALENIKRVATVDFVGYSREHGCYVWGDVAVKDGHIFALNDEDYFDLPGRVALKTLNQGIGLRINTDRDDYTTEWVDWIWGAFGTKGIVALAFWLGSLFAEQIRGDQKSFPFLEVVGEPGAGKSTLIEFLWKLVGRVDYEGFDPSKSTLAARARNFAQVANLPVVLIEGDRDDKNKGFDWDELKTAYNGRSVRARGLKNSGNDTYEPPFRGAIVISQNAPVNASEAILQRIVHLHFDRRGHVPATKVLAEQLERANIEHVSGWALSAAKREAQIVAAVISRTPIHAEALLANRELKSVRIAKNHAQLMALVESLAQLMKLSVDQVAATHQELRDMALARQSAINADHPQVTEFWELFDYLNERSEPRGARVPVGLEDEDIAGEPLNHARDRNHIAVSLVQFAEGAARQGLRHAPLAELKPLLRTSKARKFIDIKTVNSRHGGRSVKCWVFSTSHRDPD